MSLGFNPAARSELAQRRTASRSSAHVVDRRSPGSSVVVMTAVDDGSMGVSVGGKRRFSAKLRRAEPKKSGRGNMGASCGRTCALLEGLLVCTRVGENYPIVSLGGNNSNELPGLIPKVGDVVNGPPVQVGVSMQLQTMLLVDTLQEAPHGRRGRVLVSP